jgi:hypothetical protein
VISQVLKGVWNAIRLNCSCEYALLRRQYLKASFVTRELNQPGRRVVPESASDFEKKCSA